MPNNYYDKLDYLIVLAEEKNLTRAAARLFLSQPALTAYLNRLESDLGVKLFDRSKTPVELTRAGSMYITEMERMRNRRMQLYNDLRHLQVPPERSLAIAIGRNRGGIWLPRILPGVYEKFPDAHLSIVEDRDDNMAENVARQIIDVAIMESYILNPWLTYYPLPDEKHLLVTGYSNPAVKGMDLSGNSRTNPLDVPASLLNKQIFICPSLKGSLNRYTQQLFSSYNIHPQETLFISNNVAAYQLAVKGIGVTYLSTNYADIVRTDEKPLFLMPGRTPAIRPIFAVYSTQQPMTPLKQFLIDHTEAVMRAAQAEHGEEEV